ncbi:LysR family transcriptional regulator [Noviherbaspirillum pedocola]|uniref:LysR family transcriptional regulator n=1 Tax=Noviherbaspirillum pedocola TaxID=2801341 RepID=A0A934T329_9BURK|nr:LysR family transcriptional regulator [Noviherbaspirillum pedocola]MBK4737393.1 LysR family transcriptional regulator [Noviherbaspirillum pedocola]
MDISKVDLNLLVVFDAMFQTQSVTLAAELVGLSQSTMSYELAKLRQLFDDPLFVRMSTGMQPTPRALQLAGPVRSALEIIKSDVLKQFQFDPIKSKKVFTLCMTDIAEMTFMPRILRFLAVDAPEVNIRTVIMDHASLERAMANGEVDLAIGYFPDLKKAGFFQQRLFPHTFIGVVRKSHPRIGSTITLQQFLKESHVVVTPEGRSQEIVERMLEKKGYLRRVALTTPHFASVPFIIAASDLIGIVPIGLANAFSNFAELKTVDLPFSLPDFDVRQHWHERFHKDEENKWLRKKIASEFANN